MTVSTKTFPTEEPVWCQKTGYDIQKRRLAAPARPDDAEESRNLHPKTDAVNAGYGPAGCVVSERDVARLNMTIAAFRLRVPNLTRRSGALCQKPWTGARE